MENNVPIGLYYIRVLRVGPKPKYQGAKFPDVEMYFMPMQCQHCKDAPCVKACPQGAFSKTAEGIVLLDRNLCVGAQQCTLACPYGVPQFNKDQYVTEKCTLCSHLVQEGGKPMCVTGCVGLARTFGDLDDPNSKVSKLVAEAGDKVHTLPDSGNSPAFKYILGKETWVDIWTP